MTYKIRLTVHASMAWVCLALSASLLPMAAMATQSPSAKPPSPQPPAAAQPPQDEASAPQAKPSSEKPHWRVTATDHTLRTVLTRWAADAGWQLVWDLPVDYAIDARAHVVGSFEFAVENVVNSMQHVEVPMKAIFYRGNRVLRIVAKGSQ